MSQARNALEQQSNAEALKQVQSTADQFDAYLDRVAVLPRAITARKEATGMNEAASGIVPFLARLLDSLPPEEAFGVYLAKDGMMTGPDAMPWVDRNSFPQVLQPQDWPSRPFQGVVRRSQAYRPDVYFGALFRRRRIQRGNCERDAAFLRCGGKVRRRSRRGPFARSHPRHRHFPALSPRQTRQLHRHRTQHQDYSFLITRSGRIMAHPNAALSMNQNFAGADVRTVPGGNDIAARDSGFARLLDNGVARRVYWAKAPLTGWKVAMSIPEMEITGSASQLAVRTVAVAGLAVFLLVLVVWIVARRLTEPVRV